MTTTTLKPGDDALDPVITREGGEYVLRARVRLHAPLDVVFSFFSNARNLEKITPALLQFKILTPDPIEMKTDARIDYALRIHGIPMRWRTRITAWEPPHRFEDIQERGPYKQWIHEHHFVDEGTTTLMQDTVRYRVRGGALVHRFFVRRDVLAIFNHRKDIISEVFESG